MAKFNLSSVYSSESTFTILKLLKELCKTIDSVDFEEEIKDSNGNPIPMEWFSKMFDKIQISDDGTVEIGKDLEVDGNSKIGEWEVRTLQSLPSDGSNHWGLFYDTESGTLIIGWVTMQSETQYIAGGFLWDVTKQTWLIVGDGFQTIGEKTYAEGNAMILSDLIAKVKNPTKTYTHCVTINYAPTEDEMTKVGCITFMANSSRNLPCDSWQDVLSLFGGRKIMATGIAYSGKSARPYIQWLDLHGGTLATAKIGVAGTAAFPPLTQPKGVLLSDFFGGSATLTITDDVIVVQ